MKSRFLLVSLLLLPCHSISIFAQSSVDKAFSDLEKEFGGCQVELQSKNALMAKATAELTRLDGLVTELKSELTQHGETNIGLTSQLDSAKSDLAQLKGIETKAKACADKSAKASSSLSATAGAYVAVKKELESITNKNDALIAQNQSLKESLKSKEQALITLKQLSSVKPVSDNQDPQTISLLQSENNTLIQKIARLELQLKTQNETRCVAAPNTIESASCEQADSSNDTKLKIKNTSATTTYKRGFAGNLIDGNLKTHWASNQGAIAGQSIRLNLQLPAKVSKIYLSIPQTGRNLPPKVVTLYFSNGSSQVISLPKKFGFHRISIQPTNTSTVDVEFTEFHQLDNIPTQHVQHVVAAELELFGS